MSVIAKSLRGASVGFAGLLMASSAALAQNCTTTQTGTPITNIGTLAVPTSSTATAISATIGNVNTAFLSQQGSAFVSAPGNPAPDQPGGGVWVRGVGGQANVSSTSRSTGVSTQGGATFNTTSTGCATSQRQTFAGALVGADIARLNWSGWNLHLGTAAGYLSAKTTDNAGFGNSFEVPFFGTYLVATKGRFFADLMVRQEFYNMNLNNPGFSFANQPTGAHGYSISASTGYNFDLGQGWFIEPSAGFIYSKTSVDNFTAPGVFGANFTGITGTVQTNDVVSEIGRASLRVGKAIETPTVIWQPFATASVFHEFAGEVVSNYVSLNGVFPNPPGTNPFTYTQQTVTSRVGTYGQYSLGLAGQIVNTGFLGFVRVDYRNGGNIDGWTGNAGIRYQFTPEVMASAMPTKALKAPRAMIGATNWTGFYVGGFFGGAAGQTGISFANLAIPGSKPWVVGALGGGQIGYNYHFSSNWVLGFEGDIGATNAHGARTVGTTGAALFAVQDKSNWMATATARVGYASGRTLYYLKGGAAFEDSTVSLVCHNPQGTVGNGNACTVQGNVVADGAGPSTSRTRVGWTIGYGTEFDLGKNWSAKAEYDYISFGRHTALGSDGITLLTDKADTSQVKVGLNYRFTPGVVVAKY